MHLMRIDGFFRKSARAFLLLLTLPLFGEVNAPEIADYYVDDASCSSCGGNRYADLDEGEPASHLRIPLDEMGPPRAQGSGGEFRHLGAPPMKLGEGGGLYLNPTCSPETKQKYRDEGYTVNFEDISVVQFIQFISKISGSNFVFNSDDLNFNITIISDEPTTAEELSAALIQVLKMHQLSVVEQGNNLLIYRNSQNLSKNLSKVPTIITDENIEMECMAAIVTRVFRLYNVDPTRIQHIVKPLLSPEAIVEVSVETRHLIVTDTTSNVNKIADLLSALDTPNASFDIVEYRVKSAYPTSLVAYAKEILAPLTQDNALQMIAQPSSNKIFIVSTPYLNQKAIDVLKALDSADITEVADLPAHALANNNFYMYKLKYQNGQDIADTMREIGNNLQFAGVANLEFVNTIYSMQWLAVNNSIVITGSDNAIKKVVSLLDDLDKPPKQVYVEVLILDTTLANSLDFGVQWIALGDEQNRLAYGSGLLSNVPPNPNLQGNARSVAIGGTPGSPPGLVPGIPNPGWDVPLPSPAQLAGIASITNQTSAFGLGIVGNILRHNGESFLTLGALVSALDEEEETKIVLNPRIMVEDTQTAIFFVGRNIPYQTTSTVIQQTGSVTQNFQYEDIGVQLTVTPTIAPNNVVTLEINQSISLLETLVTQGVIAPQTLKTLATTRVHVPDNCFLVMSGHITDEATNIRSGIPCLGTLPLIGPIFSRNIEQRQKRNLIMFIRPKVVTNIQEGIDLTNQEGCQYNFESHPCSMYDCGQELAPECEMYPPPPCPDH